jgi:hypothetical protein
MGAIQLSRRPSGLPGEKFDPTKSIPNLRYQGPIEELEPLTSQNAPPQAISTYQEGATGRVIQQMKPETDFREENFDSERSAPNLSYPEVEDVGAVKEVPVNPQSDKPFVSSKSIRIMNNQSSKAYETPRNSFSNPNRTGRNSQTQTQDPSLTSVLTAAQPDRKSSLRHSSTAGVDSINLVRPSMVKISQRELEYPVEATRDARSVGNTEDHGKYEDETLISSQEIPTGEDLDNRERGRRDSRQPYKVSAHNTTSADNYKHKSSCTKDARPLIKVNEDSTMSIVKYKHELNDIMRSTSDDQLPALPRELERLMDKYHDVPLSKLMHFNETGAYLRESFMNNNICDIHVFVGNETYPAHRIVLASFSPYLASVLKTNNQQRHEEPKDIRISGVSEQSVKILLNYIYTGELRMEAVIIPDLLKLADKFEVPVVRQKCLNHVDVMTDDELVALLQIMKDTNDVESCNRIMRGISSKFMRVKDCKTFLLLDIDTLCIILTQGALILRSEMDVFRSGLNWLHNVDENERCNYLDRVMGCVRFPLMNQAELYECVDRCDLLRSSSSCMQRIHEANWYRIHFTCFP